MDESRDLSYNDSQWRRRTQEGGGGAATSIQITALDGIVNVNSLFTLAVFVGLAWNPNDPSNSLAGECAAGNGTAEDMISFHVYSFSSFLFSSLVALCLKQAIRIVGSNGYGHRHHHHHGVEWVVGVNKGLLRAGILVSAVGSVSGCLFLMLALVNVVQIKLGRLGCGGAASTGAIVPLVILVPAAMLIYISIVFYAFTR